MANLWLLSRGYEFACTSRGFSNLVCLTKAISLQDVSSKMFDNFQNSFSSLVLNLKWILVHASHFDCISLNAVHICAVQSCPVL